MNKLIFAVIAWFIAGAVTFFAYDLYQTNSALELELSGLRNARQLYQQQVQVNAQQREEFETQIQQLQSNLRGAQGQMSNLSEALQQTRELIDPGLLVTDPDDSAADSQNDAAVQ